jgi:hypothetical protein
MSLKSWCQILLPIEVIGEAGLTKKVTVNLADASKVKGLWMLINNLSYENKASVKINNGQWIKLNNSTVSISEPAKSYGGIGGAFHVGSMKITLPVQNGTLVNGENTISFKFEFTDGISSGFRVVRFNFVDSKRVKLLPSNMFKEDDPNTWKQPITGSAAASAGKILWETKNITEGPQSNIILKAKCGDCHAKNGRDLKYFNYSNESIIARSKFHKLSQTEAEQVASYIRSLDVPNPGRPWNPPYQPGPGIDSKPINEWSAGAGIDWVLDKDEMVYPFLFPNGIDYSEISLSKTLNVRETPVMMQFPDWNHWLPTVHPYDASFGGDNFINSGVNYLYNGKGNNTNYKYNLTDIIEAGENATLPNGTKFRTIEGFKIGLGDWNNESYKFINPLIEEGLATPNGVSGPVNWTRRYAEEVYSFKLWMALKQWELFNGNDLEGMGKILYGSKGEERTWPGIYRHVFDVSPHLAKIPREDYTSFNNKKINQIYTSNVWYHVQPVLSSGNTYGGGFSVVDWQYAHGNLNDLRKGGINTSIAEPGRKLILYFKQMQQKHQNYRGAGPENPWYGWDILRDHSIGDIVYFDSEGLLDRSDKVIMRQIMNALLSVWYVKSSSYPASLYKTGNDSYDVTGYDSWIYDMVVGFRAKEVDCQLLNKIVDFAKTLPPSKKLNWDALKVSCTTKNYPSVKIISPSNATVLNKSNFTVEVSAKANGESISKVEFYNDGDLIGTDINFPYQMELKNMNPGMYYIIAKAYNQSGEASADTKVVIISEDGQVTSNDQDVKKMNENIIVYPNPTKDEIYFSENVTSGSSYEVMSIEGKTLHSGIYKGEKINLNQLNSGVYLIKIKLLSGDRIFKLFKE